MANWILPTRGYEFRLCLEKKPRERRLQHLIVGSSEMKKAATRCELRRLFSVKSVRHGSNQLTPQDRESFVAQIKEDPPYEGLYTPRKEAANPKRRIDLIKYERSKGTPYLVLAESIRTRGENLKKGYDDARDKLVYADNTELDQAMSLSQWDTVSHETEVLASRLHDIPKDGTLVIVGGGISGLSLAWFVAHSRPDVRIRILEQEDHVGGYMHTMPSQTENNADYFEQGPRTLLPSHPGTVIAAQMMKDIGLGDKLVGVPKNSPTNRKGLVFDGKLVQLPNSFKQLLSFMSQPLSKGLKLGPIKDLFFAKARPPKVHDESVGSFLSRRLNSKIVTNLASAVMRGIYAGDINKLSARSVARLNRLYLLERLQSSSIMGSMISKMATDLDSYGNRVFPVLAQLLTGKRFPGFEALKKQYSMVGVDGGMQQFAVHLKNSLESRFGDRVFIDLGSTVKEIKTGETKCQVVIDNGGEKIDGDIVVSTVSAPTLRHILSGLGQEESQLLDEFEYSTLAVINIQTPVANLLPDWFGFLVPHSENANNKEDVLGVIFDSRVRGAMEPVSEYINMINKQTAAREEMDMIYGTGARMEPEAMDGSGPKLRLPEWKSIKQALKDQFEDERVAVASRSSLAGSSPSSTLSSSGSNFTVMMGGDRWTGIRSQLTREEIIENCFGAIEKYLGQKIDPTECKINITMQKQSIPQYHVGHSDKVQQVQDAVTNAYSNRLLLSGMTFGRGVGVSDCIIDSLTIATRFAPERKLMAPRFYLNNLMLLTQPGHYA